MHLQHALKVLPDRVAGEFCRREPLMSKVGALQCRLIDARIVEIQRHLLGNRHRAQARWNPRLEHR